MNNPTIWNQLLVWPIINLLLVFYKLFEFLHIPSPLGFSVILLTIVMRMILYPLMHAQLKSAKKMSALKPHLDALSVKHKDDKQKLQQAQMELYKQHGVNPAAGCLPLLVQLPVLIALYNVFYQVLGNGNINKVTSEINNVAYFTQLHITKLDLSFLGTNLGVKPDQWQVHGWWLLTIPVITGLLQWYQTKLMIPAASKPKSQTSMTKQIQNTNEKKEEKPTDTMAEMQNQMAIISPIMFGFFAYQLPLGLSLYWNIFGLFGIMQQLKVNKQV